MGNVTDPGNLAEQARNERQKRLPQVSAREQLTDLAEACQKHRSKEISDTHGRDVKSAFAQAALADLASEGVRVLIVGKLYMENIRLDVMEKTRGLLDIEAVKILAEKGVDETIKQTRNPDYAGNVLDDAYDNSRRLLRVARNAVVATKALN